ncbi:MAG: nucleotidyltransferase family protein [Chromatiales bacterium]|nr:nucleotidyltransferase family protein [Chromatiales bacterium]
MASREGMVHPRIEALKPEIAAFCERNAIERMAAFGSVTRDDFTAESDIDILVEFAPGKTVGYEFIDIQDDLARLLGHKVDLYTFAAIARSRNHLLRSEILGSAEMLYEQA